MTRQESGPHSCHLYSQLCLRDKEVRDVLLTVVFIGLRYILAELARITLQWLKFYNTV